jgi:RNA-binding protein 26
MPPLDPNNPMAALLAMQAMGIPFPGMPPYPQAASPVGQAGSPIGGFPPPAKRNQRCRDYDTKGFCARGNTCIYEHGTDSIFVPPNAMDGTYSFFLGCSDVSENAVSQFIIISIAMCMND